jgi:hypothetical protein
MVSLIISVIFSNDSAILPCSFSIVSSNLTSSLFSLVTWFSSDSENVLPQYLHSSLSKELCISLFEDNLEVLSPFQRILSRFEVISLDFGLLSVFGVPLIDSHGSLYLSISFLLILPYFTRNHENI